ncbi:MAG: DUF1553 domain-containing protein [Pirellulaceae bacterium]
MLLLFAWAMSGLAPTPLVAEDAQLPPAATRKVDFAADIQTLFRKNCFSCHGPEHQEGGLRLDQKKRALEGGDSGQEIVPGKSAASRLVRVVAGVDEDFGQMPPEGKGTPLTAAEIGLIRAWIDRGADWPDDAQLAQAASRHWSLQPIVRPAVPLTDPNKTALAIDAFILARLAEQQIAPAPPAEPATLLRRLSLDLLGLPPSPEEVAALAADTRPDAIARQTDRLLASPHFGERWGRHWLDLARYADSDGYEKDRPRPLAWRYRDWVIGAINADMPYDQFTIEQLAGDMLPGASVAQQTASGLHRNTLHNTEGGIDPEEDRVKKTVDRTNTLGVIWLGLTVGCAQCHTHKYDPITQREYYSLYAIFNNLDETDIEAPTPEQAARLVADRAAHAERLAELRQALTAYEQQELPAAQAEWERAVAAAPPVWRSLELTSQKSKHGATFARREDGATLVGGTNTVSDVYTLEAELSGEALSGDKLTAIRLEVLPDKSLPKSGPGRSKSGNFVLSTFSATVRTPGSDRPVQIELAAARADFAQKNFAADLALNDNPADGWAIGPQLGQRHVAVFELKEPPAFPPGTLLTIALDQTYGKPAVHNLGCFRLSFATAPSPVPLEGVPENIARIAGIPRGERTAAQANQIDSYYRALDARLVQLAKDVTDHQAKLPKLPAGQQAQAVSQRSEPRVTNVLLRGDFLSPGDAVAAGTLSVLPPLAPRGAAGDRLDLARWLVDPANPLPARVAANRVWQHLFGRGLVVTSDDFGKQGEPPSHPELLDWLASEYVADGWSLKELVRTIVGSATYRQSSAPRPELAGVDPENVLLARQSRLRVEAEIIRDVSLATGGLLATGIGGPSVRPPQPAEYAGVTYANSAKWSESAGADRYRRGLYTFFQRTSPYPMLMTFDAPDSNECTVRRQTSNTPLQALTLWNDPVFFEAARSLARRTVSDIPSSEAPWQTVRARAAHAFQLGLARQPSETEVADLVALYHAHWQLAAADETSARQMVGPEPPPANCGIAELAAWIGVGRTILNLDEFITRE